jgi:geranylgeranyl pyrophosphate synthase
MKFNAAYPNYINEINEYMLAEKNLFLQELSVYAPKADYLFQKLVDTTDGGKRIRGFLLLLAYEMCGGKNKQEAIKGAVAYEIFQSAILIHDDVIDCSPTRRDTQTIHHALGNNHYGNSQAICLGDVGFFWAMRKLNSIELNKQIKYQLIEAFSNIKIKTGIGEILDVELANNSNFIKADIDEMHYYKTAIYSVIGPMQLGAIMAGASHSLIDLVEKIGKNLGLAFQIQDDIIGIYSDEEKTGKSSKSDIEENKITHLYFYALEHCNSADLEDLKSMYGKKNIALQEINRIKEIFVSCGALNFANNLINNYLQESKKEISRLEIADQFKEILFSFCDYLCKREY